MKHLLSILLWTQGSETDKLSWSNINAPNLANQCGERGASCPADRFLHKLWADMDELCYAGKQDICEHLEATAEVTGFRLLIEVHCRKNQLLDNILHFPSL